MITPPLDGSILAGITRASTIDVLRASGHQVYETSLTIEDLCAGLQSGAVREIFLTGTATVIAPVSVLTFDGIAHALPDEHHVSSVVRNTIVGVQTGRRDDPFGWRVCL